MMKTNAIAWVGLTVLGAVGAWWWLANGARDQSGGGRPELSLPGGGAGLVDDGVEIDRDRIAELKKDLWVPADVESELPVQGDGC